MQPADWEIAQGDVLERVTKLGKYARIVRKRVTKHMTGAIEPPLDKMQHVQSLGRESRKMGLYQRKAFAPKPPAEAAPTFAQSKRKWELAEAYAGEEEASTTIQIKDKGKGDNKRNHGSHSSNRSITHHMDALAMKIKANNKKKFHKIESRSNKSVSKSSDNNSDKASFDNLGSLDWLGMGAAYSSTDEEDGDFYFWENDGWNDTQVSAVMEDLLQQIEQTSDMNRCALATCMMKQLVEKYSIAVDFMDINLEPMVIKVTLDFTRKIVEEHGQVIKNYSHVLSEMATVQKLSNRIAELGTPQRILRLWRVKYILAVKIIQALWRFKWVYGRGGKYMSGGTRVIRMQQLSILKKSWKTLHETMEFRTSLILPQLHLLQLLSDDGASQAVSKDRRRIISAGILTPLLNTMLTTLKGSYLSTSESDRARIAGCQLLLQLSHEPDNRILMIRHVLMMDLIKRLCGPVKTKGRAKAATDQMWGFAILDSLAKEAEGKDNVVNHFNTNTSSNSKRASEAARLFIERGALDVVFRSMAKPGGPGNEKGGHYRIRIRRAGVSILTRLSTTSVGRLLVFRAFDEHSHGMRYLIKSMNVDDPPERSAAACALSSMSFLMKHTPPLRTSIEKRFDPHNPTNPQPKFMYTKKEFLKRYLGLGIKGMDAWTDAEVRLIPDSNTTNTTSIKKKIPNTQYQDRTGVDGIGPNKGWITKKQYFTKYATKTITPEGETKLECNYDVWEANKPPALDLSSKQIWWNKYGSPIDDEIANEVARISLKALRCTVVLDDLQSINETVHQREQCATLEALLAMSKLPERAKENETSALWTKEIIQLLIDMRAISSIIPLASRRPVPDLELRCAQIGVLRWLSSSSDKLTRASLSTSHVLQHAIDIFLCNASEISIIGRTKANISSDLRKARSNSPSSSGNKIDSSIALLKNELLLANTQYQMCTSCSRHVLEFLSRLINDAVELTKDDKKKKNLSKEEEAKAKQMRLNIIADIGRLDRIRSMVLSNDIVPFVCELIEPTDKVVKRPDCIVIDSALELMKKLIPFSYDTTTIKCTEKSKGDLGGTEGGPSPILVPDTSLSIFALDKSKRLLVTQLLDHLAPVLARLIRYHCTQSKKQFKNVDMSRYHGTLGLICTTISRLSASNDTAHSLTKCGISRILQEFLTNPSLLLKHSRGRHPLANAGMPTRGIGATGEITGSQGDFGNLPASFFTALSELARVKTNRSNWCSSGLFQACLERFCLRKDTAIGGRNISLDVLHCMGELALFLGRMSKECVPGQSIVALMMAKSGAIEQLIGLCEKDRPVRVRCHALWCLAECSNFVMSVIPRIVSSPKSSDGLKPLRLLVVIMSNKQEHMSNRVQCARILGNVARYPLGAFAEDLDEVGCFVAMMSIGSDFVLATQKLVGYLSLADLCRNIGDELGKKGGDKRIQAKHAAELAVKNAENDELFKAAFGDLSKMTELQLRQKFKEIDVDGSGELDEGELFLALSQAMPGRKIQMKEVQAMMKHADRNTNPDEKGAGTIDYTEFLQLCSDMANRDRRKKEQKKKNDARKALEAEKARLQELNRLRIREKKKKDLQQKTENDLLPLVNVVKNCQIAVEETKQLKKKLYNEGKLKATGKAELLLIDRRKNLSKAQLVLKTQRNRLESENKAIIQEDDDNASLNLANQGITIAHKKELASDTTNTNEERLVKVKNFLLDSVFAPPFSKEDGSIGTQNVPYDEKKGNSLPKDVMGFEARRGFGPLPEDYFVQSDFDKNKVLVRGNTRLSAGVNHLLAYPEHASARLLTGSFFQHAEPKPWVDAHNSIKKNISNEMFGKQEEVSLTNASDSKQSSAASMDDILSTLQKSFNESKELPKEVATVRFGKINQKYAAGLNPLSTVNAVFGGPSGLADKLSHALWRESPNIRWKRYRRAQEALMSDSERLKRLDKLEENELQLLKHGEPQKEKSTEKNFTDSFSHEINQKRPIKLDQVQLARLGILK